ncbi:MAG: response regulator, partial [Mameliella sp.]|nr:response regulator [Phaeodactylibacter sp.]
MTYRVLLVDDDDIDVMAFKRALKKTGLDFITEVTDSGSKAHELVQRHHFDCIFLDFLLPKTDGLTMLKELKASGVDCPIIIITSQGDENLAVEMMKEGAFDYFTKDELRPEKLRKILSNANAFNQLITERQET